MQTMEVVKRIMKMKHVKPSDMCKFLNVKSNVLSERFKQQNISLKLLNDMIKPLGYKVIIVPDNKLLEDDEFEVE